MRRPRLWLLAALALFALAAAFLSRAEDRSDGKSTREKVEFPRFMDSDSWKRAEQRQTLPPLPAAAAAPNQPAPPPERPRRDPLLSALPTASKGVAMVVEANAITNSPIGKLLLECLRNRGPSNPLQEMREQTGLDLERDLDRIAVSGDTVVASGNFGKADFAKLFENHRAIPYGDKGVIYLSENGQPTAVWDNQMIMEGGDEQALRRSIDQVEGRLDPGEPAIPQEATYGEIYGVIGAEAIAKLLGGQNDELAKRFREAAQRIELHVDSMNDVAMVARVNGPDSSQVDDLSRTLGAAMALGRVKAQASGEKDLAELLDLAQVVPAGNGAFSFELALPMQFLEKHLAFCRQKNPPQSPADQSAVLDPAQAPHQ